MSSIISTYRFALITIPIFLYYGLFFDGNKHNTKDKIPEKPKRGYIKDRDGNKYDTIHYKGYAIMVENLKTTTFANGDKIERIKSAKDWKNNNKEQKPGYCYYNNSKGYNKEFGVLYTPYTIYDERQLAPDGWHIPTSKEWKKIIGGYSNRNPNLSLNCRLYTKKVKEYIEEAKKPYYKDLIAQKLNFTGHGFRDYKGNFKGMQGSTGRAAYVHTSDDRWLQVDWLGTKIRDNDYHNTFTGNLGAYIRCVKKLN